MEESEKLKRVVDARMKLKARFEEKIKLTPSVADNKPMGKGKPNRHGMPVIPVGQIPTKKWPVLDLGIQPDIPLDKWKRFKGEFPKNFKPEFTINFTDLEGKKQTIEKNVEYTVKQ